MIRADCSARATSSATARCRRSSFGSPPTPRPFDVARVLAAATLVDAPLHVSVAPGYAGPLGHVVRRAENGDHFIEWAKRALPDRVRLLGDEPALHTGWPATIFLDDRPPISDGRIELLRYLREQTVSRTLHRFGNLISSGRAPTHDGALELCLPDALFRRT